MGAPEADPSAAGDDGGGALDGSEELSLSGVSPSANGGSNTSASGAPGGSGGGGRGNATGDNLSLDPPLNLPSLPDFVGIDHSGITQSDYIGVTESATPDGEPLAVLQNQQLLSDGDDIDSSGPVGPNPPITVTPEPTSLLLLGTGLALAARGLKRRATRRTSGDGNRRE